MATRDGQPLDLIWVLLDITGLNIEQVRSRVATKLASDLRLANCLVSFNINAANTQALVLINADNTWLTTLPAAIQSRIIRVYHESDHDQAVTLVNDIAWTG